MMLEKENEALRDRIAVLENTLGLTQELDPNLLVKFTPSEGRLLGMLLARGFVAREAFHAALYQNRPDADEVPEIKIVDVIVCHVRRKLADLGLPTIQTKHGEGYFIPAGDKPALRKALEGEAA